MAQRDPWEVYSAPPPSSIAGPPKTIDPLDAERLDLSRQSGARDQVSADRTQTNTQFDNITSMRKEFTSRKPVADYTLVLPQVASAMKIAGSGKATGADDLNLIYTFGKVMDPGSVVREGELALASDTGSFAQSLEGAAQKLKNGEKLPDAVRRNLVETMRRRGIELANSYNLERSTYKELAQRNGFDPFEVVGKHPAEPFQQAEADFTKHTIGNLDGSVGARPEGYQAPAPAAPIAEGDIGFNVGADQQATVTPQQEQAFAAFFKNNPKPSSEQIQAFADSIGFSKGHQINNLDEVARGIAAGRSFGGITESTPEAIKTAAGNTVDGSVGSSVVAGIADSVPFAPQIAAVADTLGLTEGRPNVWNGDMPIGDAYAFNRDANNLALTNAADANPIPYALGQAGGLLAGGVMASRAIPALGRVGAWAAEGSLPAQIAKSAPLEAGYGALYGAGRNPDSPFKGALNNGLAAAGGGALGRGTIGAVGALVAPSAGKLGALYDAKVKPTIGQRIVGTGVVGNAVNGLEEAMQSFPGLGYMVRGAREGSRDQFERGGFNTALGQIGDELPEVLPLGTQAHAYMQEAFDKGYSETLPKMRAVADEGFKTGTEAIVEEVANGALNDESARRFNTIINAEVTRRMGNGELAGDELKAAISTIGKRIRNERSKATGDRDLASLLEDYVDELKGAAARHSDPADVERLGQLDRGYAMAVRLEDASAARAGEPGRFSPIQLDRSVQKNSGGIRSRSYLRGDALLQDYAEAGRSLVDRLPNSGTPERLLITQGATAGPVAALGYTNPVGAATAAALTLPYAPGVRRITQGLIAPRQTPQLNTLGNLIRRNAALGGGAGAAGGLAVLPGSAPNGN